ncbi:hypothetical protein ACLQ25_31135 [Micromonospora sp. DT44]|uniref:hypothetical protein n=1 Tax=Micromonospora sp. DT44 TaxID=3393439 RepID=UPI003CEBCBC0
MDDAQTQAGNHAWNWYAMHAGQRMQLVNFWVVAVAFLATALVQAMNSRQTPVAVGVALTGVVVSLTFQQLDVRARQGERVAE